MKALQICVIIGLYFVMKGATQTINCYVCDNCDHLGDSQLQSCPLQDSTNSPTTDLTESSTISTEESSPSDSSGSPLATISTTASTPNPTQEPVTETSKTETTSVKTEETEPTETNQPITNEAQETTVTSSSKTEISTNTIPESPETPRPSITTLSENSIPTNGISEAFKPSLTESSELPPEKSDPIEETASMINLPPPAQTPSEAFKPETLNSVAPAAVSILQPSQSNQSYQILNRNPRGIRYSRSAPSYHCYSISFKDGDSSKVKKGCVEVPEKEGACDVLKKELGTSIDKCKICTEDKCNGSSTLKNSIITLVMVLVVRSFY